MTIIDNPLAKINRVTAKTLQAASFQFPGPFELLLTDQQLLLAKEVIRLVPKRRMVVFGEWMGREVVAKLFFDSIHARRHWQRELAGLKILKDNNIPTPQLYYEGQSEDKRVYLLIFERIYDGKSLQYIWQDHQNKDELQTMLSAVMIELATQHVLGVVQADLHLGNFLVADKNMYVVDGGQIEVQPFLLPKKQSIQHIALFLSQLGAGVMTLQNKLFRYYAKSRGWLLKPIDFLDLHYAIKKNNLSRWKNFKKKIFRNSTDFLKISSWYFSGMIKRKYLTPEIQAFLKNPETLFQHPTMEILKAGRSATVIKVVLENQAFVVKRYNIKGPWHFLRRALRATRAQASWRIAQKLNLFGIATARPVAFIERRFLGLRGKSYYMTEFVSGEDIGKYFFKDKIPLENSVIKSITDLLKSTFQLNITHGDLKTNNIILDKNEVPFLIDLDGSFEHVSMSSLRHAWRKEIKRFLKNFKDYPLLKYQFEMELKKD